MNYQTFALRKDLSLFGSRDVTGVAFLNKPDQLGRHYFRLFLRRLTDLRVSKILFIKIVELKFVY